MQLSKNFSLNELTKSQTAIRLGITNVPSSQEIFNLKNLCENVLQRVRDRFKEPVIINSGYRSVKLCQAIGSSGKSQHAKGQAADIEVVNIDNKIVAEWIKNNLEYELLWGVPHKELLKKLAESKGIIFSFEDFVLYMKHSLQRNINRFKNFSLGISIFKI